MFETQSTDHGLRTSSRGYVLLTKWRESKVAGHMRQTNAILKKRAKHREFEVGDMVYLYNPAIKKGVSTKFRRPWQGPWRVTEKKSRLNYAIVDERGRRLIVHVNRLKRAYGSVDWERADRRKPSRKDRPKRRRTTEEDEGEETLSPGPIEIRAPLVENPPVERRTPGRGQNMDTPAGDFSPPEAPSNHRADPTYVPSDTPLSRRELGSTRPSPVQTRFRARQHRLEEVPEEGGDE